MNRIAAAALSLLLVVLTACSGGTSINSSPSNSPLNMAGTWTVTTVSTQGNSSSSGMATVSQSGPGLAVDGTTTIAAPVGQIVVSQTGTALTGTIANSLTHAAFNFTGTLSSGNFTVTGSILCLPSKATQATSVTGKVTSTSVQGSYTITHGSGCYYSGDAGTFVATKK